MTPKLWLDPASCVHKNKADYCRTRPGSVIVGGSMKREFDTSIHYFRAITILIIVFGHFELWGRSDIVYSSVLNLVKGGTALFVFISGYLFTYIYSAHWNYVDFIKRKILNVLVPYLIISTLFFVCTRAMDFTTTGRLQNSLIPAYMHMLVFGKAAICFWYIPFIMMVFLMAPLHRLFFRARPVCQISLLVVLFTVSALIHRPPGNNNLFQALLYFTPFYLAGGMWGRNKQFVTARWRKYSLLFLLAACGLAFIQAAVFARTGNYAKPVFTWNGIDLMVLQKILLIVFFMLILSRRRGSPAFLPDLIAKTSFTVFFLHMFVGTFILDRLPLLRDMQGFSWHFWLLFPCIVTLLCILAALAVRKLLKTRSKYVAGY